MFSSVPDERDDGMDQPQAKARDQLRFPLALKKARLTRQLKQETLAAHLQVKLRTLVSWETGTRIPSVGMVALLSLLLSGDLRLENDLLRAYVADDLARHASMQQEGESRAFALAALEQLSHSQARGQEHKQEEAPRLSLLDDQARTEEHVPLLADQGRGQQQQRPGEATGDPFQQLFTVLETLHDHPDLIPVAQDFLREMVQE